MSERIAHYEEFNGYFSEMKPLNPTGRWKLRRDHNGNIHMLIEHKGIVFKSWKHESGIQFLYEESEIINTCAT